MATMLVIATTAVPDHVRGALSRWLTEPTAGLYVGTVTAKVRDELWDAVAASVADGEAVCIHPAPTEQGFAIKTAGERRRRIIDFDGLQLVRFLPPDTPDPNENHDKHRQKSPSCE
ncbi:type I-E CRISPR-associated endoribonuclease Cas2e [Nocardia sp. NEAU-G5]|uniref:Type I-E CRISPR-associated endoribonuclease Cas2e n=1 Tax=Nocardia albiluteola TaxID=2842303 RepID=A0ABS6AYN8_9NOCA|nr:type I-E CRISPR-associated endoribonuclease Cas2e [Nocardia albiluteola]MBU3063162.1 type I-E CRISPR-associated endoribonuclease Cas2e [Nocardia albiluteola]